MISVREVLTLFPYGPHFSPDQNRALASLAAALANAKPEDTGQSVEQRLAALEQEQAELNDALEKLEVWQGLQEQANHAHEIMGLKDELERLGSRIDEKE